LDKDSAVSFWLMQTKIEKIDSSSALAIKIIDPSIEETLDFLSFREKLSLANISHQSKRREWATARLAIKDALDVLKIPYPGFFKDEHGKSQVMIGSGFVSLTHTNGLAAAIFNTNTSVGIDLEHVKERVLKIGPKFLSESELDFVQKDPLLHTIAWSAKESIFKCQGKRGVSFRENILLSPFDKNTTTLKGKIIGTEYDDHHFDVEVRVIANVVLTYTRW
jgi:enterobactin synthetase component D